MSEKITEGELIEMYEQSLDETKEEWIKKYHGGEILKEVDPIAYRVGLSDYESSLAEDGIVVRGGGYDDEEEKEWGQERIK